MSEPTTIEEMHARAQAARERMDAAARRHQLRAADEAHQEAVDAESTATLIEIVDASPPITKAIDPSTLVAAPFTLRGNVNPRFLLAQVAAAAGLTINDLISARRTRELVRARRAAMAILSAVRPDYSLPRIGREFGNRDHTTVLHALRETERAIVG